MPARAIWKKFLWRGIPVLVSAPSPCLPIVARLTEGLLWSLSRRRLVLGAPRKLQCPLLGGESLPLLEAAVSVVALLQSGARTLVRAGSSGSVLALKRAALEWSKLSKRKSRSGPSLSSWLLVYYVWDSWSRFAAVDPFLLLRIVPVCRRSTVCRTARSRAGFCLLVIGWRFRLALTDLKVAPFCISLVLR